MGPKQMAQGSLFFGFWIEDHVLADHLLRKVEAVGWTPERITRATDEYFETLNDEAFTLAATSQNLRKTAKLLPTPA